MARQKRVLWWGRFDPGYSRNRVFISLFKLLGWQVDLFLVKISPRFGDLEAWFRRPPQADLIWVPVCRQRDVLAACRYGERHHIPVYFDPMISAWDKKVLEQQKWRADESRAKKLLREEAVMMNRPQRLICDTSCHADFFHRTFAVPYEKMHVLFTGTDESVFKPFPNEKPHDPTAPLRILYHGAYLPLHGTETIVEAARLTQDQPLHWDFLGWGAYKASTEAKAAGIKNITFLEKVPYVDVPRVIQTADVVLGVFGTTEKASRVIGNKIYEAMACARPVINEFCTGFPPAAANCPAIRFIPPGDPKALADAALSFLREREKLPEYNRAARSFFEQELSMSVIKDQLREILSPFA